MKRCLGLVLLLIVLTAAPGAQAQSLTRYSIAGGCFSIKQGGGDLPGGPFRMQATDLGKYLVYTPQRSFLVPGSGGAGVTTSPEPNESGNWKVDDAPGGAFTMTSIGAGTSLQVSFAEAQGCAEYPEVQTNVSGTPSGGPTPYGETRGLVDTHMHGMAFEYFGGRVHCGRPWHPYGVTTALMDCPDHYPNGAGALAENTSSTQFPVGTHDPVGWPTFKDWPSNASLTHEQSYYKWIERAWRGGQRIWVNLLVENKVLCEVYPLNRNSCDEMDSVRLQLKDMHAMQDYIDAQNGGPGKGWYRIVSDPYEARRVINEGKLAVIPGMEISEPFGCSIVRNKPNCDDAQIDRSIDELDRLGVRQFELVNKYDNALTGVAGDDGASGIETNAGNAVDTGQFWNYQACPDPRYTDRDPTAGRYPHNADDLAANIIRTYLPTAGLPVYADNAQCNARGLSSLGEHAIRRLMQKKLIFDPDHMSVLARNQALNVVESQRYSGILSSHSWSTDDAIPRIYKLGGLITPYAGDSKGFVKEWQKIRSQADPRFYFGFGYGADMGGLGSQGTPRNGPDPVQYPFKSKIDPAVTVDRQVSGSRVYDVNKDGVAHYGLYPDWIEDLHQQVGDKITEDMARGPEAYLQMWERAEGISPTDCRSARGKFARDGVFGVKLGDDPVGLLRRSGQPSARIGRAYRYCVQGTRNSKASLKAVFDPSAKVAAIVTTARGHRALRTEVGARSKRLPKRGLKKLGKGLFAKKAGKRAYYVFGVRKKQVAFIALTTKAVGKKRKSLTPYLKLAGVR